MGGQQCKGTQKKERTKEDRYCCACCHSPLCGVWEVRGRGMGGSWERTPVPLPSEIHPCHTMQCCDQSIGHPFYVDHHYVSCPRHSMLYPSRHNRDNLPPNASHTPFISSHPTVNYAHAPAKQQAMSLSPTRRQPPRGSSSSPPSSPGIRYSTVAPRPTTRLPFEGEEDDDEDEKEDTGSGARDGGKGRGGDRRTRHVQVQALVEKRTLNLDYIRRVHDGA